VTHLDNQTTRCHDATCSERAHCQRWIDRDWPPHQWRAFHAASCRTLNQAGFCMASIPAYVQERAA